MLKIFITYNKDMQRGIVILVISFFLIIAVIKIFTLINERNKIPTNSSSIQTQNSSSLPFSKTNIEVVAKDLEVPWALDFLPNGDLIFTERKGLIK